MIVRFADQTPIVEDGHPLVMYRLVDRVRHIDGLSVTWVQLWGEHSRMRTPASERVYVVVAGGGTFQVGDDAAETVGPGDVVLVPRDVAYQFEGNFTYLVLNAPAFADGDDIIEPRR